MDNSYHILLSAKTQYTGRLVKKLTEPISDFIDEIVEKAKNDAYEANEEEKTLVYIQDELEEISKYEQKKISSVAKEIKSRTECEYIEELLQSIFILHTKILNSVLSKKNEKPEVKIPCIESFIYKVLLNLSRILWKSAYIFKDITNDCVKQKNHVYVEEKITHVLIETIEEMLPIDKIVLLNVKDYYEEESDSDSDSDSDEEEAEAYKKKGKKKGFFPKRKFGGFDDDVDDEDPIMMTPPPASASPAEPVAPPASASAAAPVAPPASASAFPMPVTPAQQFKTVEVDTTPNMLDSVQAQEMENLQNNSRVQFDLAPPNVNV